MDNIIEISDLYFDFDGIKVFNGISFDIDRGDFISIVGPNNSGKTTLFRLLLGVYQSSNIKFNNVSFNDIGFVASNNSFICSRVYDELAFCLSNCGYSREEIASYIEDISTKLGFSSLLDSNVCDLSCGYKQLLSFACAIVSKPKVLILDDAFVMLDVDNRKIILEYLNELHDTSDITIINITSDMEMVLGSDKIVVINNGVICTMGYTCDVLYDDILKTIGLSIPFVTDLSINLKYYGLVDRLYSRFDDMVVRLWQ